MLLTREEAYNEMKRRILSICLALALCLSLLPGTALAAEGDPVYLALGDSITSGYGLDEGTGTPFADQVADKLGYGEPVNAAADGDTSGMLLAKLQNNTINVSNADLITITIGGNDLMNALYGHLVDKYNEGKDDGAKIDINKLKAALAAPSENMLILSGVLMPLETYLSTFLDSQAATAALTSVQTNLTSILNTIQDRNKTAKILVATQYDPYRWLNVTEGDSFENQITALKTTFAEGVGKLNTSIQTAVTAANDSNISVVDVCSAFAGSENNLCNAYYNGIATGFNLDFHPNQDGHNLIADTIVETLFEGLNLTVSDIQVTSENAADVLDGSGTVTYDPSPTP